MNSISFFKALLMKEMSEELTGGQKKLDVAEPKGKITGADFAALRAKKDVKKEDSQLEEKVDMDQLSFELSRLKKENPGKKISYIFKQDSPKGYVFFIDGKLVKEGEDHEVSMANNSLESIIKSAMELKMKLGGNERDIPGWIQDHITNAENYIDQASQGFHELHGGEHDMDELPDGTEELPAGDEEDAQMTLQSMMEDLLEVKKKPSAGLSKKQKSSIVKKAKAGKDMGKKGKGFEKIVKAAKKSGADNPEAVAGAAFWKGQAKKAK